MTGRGSLNGKTAASVSSPRIARHGRNGTGEASAAAQSNLAGVSRDRDSLSAQWSREQRLSAAQRQVDDLLKLNTLLKAECALLSESLSKAHRFAYHDPLTGLPNRRLLADHFEQAAAQAVRKHNYVVLLFLDLDGFKDINDSIGHTAADRLLQQVGSRLSSCLRGSDTACRYGGDELVVLLPDIDRPDQAFSVCEKIRSQLALPYVIDGTEIHATASLGMATFPTDGMDCFELVRSADLAMYRDKSGKRGRPPVQPKGNGSSADHDDISDPVTSPGRPFATL
jgi:diguanylate cyclase (GGDEF)-like protein